jgi:hypothetical protein
VCDVQGPTVEQIKEAGGDLVLLEPKELNNVDGEK